MNHLLIIEDDPIVGGIYRNKLSIEGFKVDLVRDGESGLTMIQNHPPDVVLLDLMMPKLTGVEVLRAMRSRPESKNIPVVVFSNTYLTNMVQEAWKAGATKCLSKANSSPKQVIEAIQSVLRQPAPAPVVAASKPVSPASPAVPERVATHSADADAAFVAELRREFLDTLPSALTALRNHLQALRMADSEMARLKQMQEFYRRVHSLTSNAGISGLAQIAQMADAFEALLKELYEKPANMNASTLRTIALAVDFLGYLFEHGATPERQEPPPAIALVVDDEAIARRAVSHALEKIKLKSVCVGHGTTALQLLAENHFDLIFLDVDMPDMNGFELCQRVRALPGHGKTPVVFVTGLSDFESRACSTLSGENDLMAKPFLFIELAVRALIYVLRSQLEAVRGPLEAKPAASR